MAKVDAALAKALGRDPVELAFLEALDDKAQAQLTADVGEARKRHREHIEHALEDALNHVPRLLRGPLKKIFGV